MYPCSRSINLLELYGRLELLSVDQDKPKLFSYGLRKIVIILSLKSHRSESKVVITNSDPKRNRE